MSQFSHVNREPVGMRAFVGLTMGVELGLLWTVLALAGSASAVEDQYSRAVVSRQ